MIGLIILLVLVIFYLLISINSKANAQEKLLESLDDRLKEINQRLHGLTRVSQEKERPTTSETKTTFKQEVPPIILESPRPEAEAAIKKEELVTPVFKTPESKQGDELATLEESVIFNYKKEEKNNDIEKFIGENLINKIGIVILVLGISFFVKYAIDKDWIQEGGRVLIGFVCGGILIGIAHRIRNKYRAFSSVLVGGGLTVLYFTIAFAFHQYHLISQQAAFLSMVAVAALGVVLSIFYNRLELSVLATIGSFITPFLVSTGQDNYIALFTYICILNAGLMVLAWFKRWPVINFIALFFTILIFCSWVINRIFGNDPMPYKPVLFFATIFYLQFVAMNIIHNLRMKKAFMVLDFMIVLGINFLYFVAGMFVLDYWSSGKYQGLFTALLAIFNLLLAFIFSKNKSVDKNFISLLIGLAVGFSSLFAFVQLDGNYITVFWAIEMVLLFWLFRRTGMKLLKIASLILSGLTLVSLIINWSIIYLTSNDIISVLINNGFITSIAVAVALFIYHRLVYRQADSYFLKDITNSFVKDCFLSTSVAVLFLAGFLETYYQFSTRHELPLYIIYLKLFTNAFTILVLWVFRQSKQIALMRILFTFFCLAFYLVNNSDDFDLSFALYNDKISGPHFIAHWIASALLFKLLFDLIIYFRKNKDSWSAYSVPFSWITAMSIILVFSLEAYYVLIWTNYGNNEHWLYAENLFYKAGLTILWAVCSFAAMWLGMKYHFRVLRIISLTIFTAILIKLFAYDIQNIPPGGKIAAFILLGVLLLIVSFMYQRLKKIIIDDSPE